MSRSDEREQDERERYNAEAAADYYGREQEAERDQVEAPMTHPQPPQEMTMDNSERIAAIEQRLEAASAGKWTACRMVHHERGDDLTPEELGEYVKNSVVKSAEASGSSAFLFVSVEKPDGDADVCHVGNGPTSPQNADLIQHAPDDLRFLLSLVKQSAHV